MESTKQILAVVVLYKMTFAQSRCLASLLNIIAEDETLANTIDVMVCDNSPSRQEPPAQFPGRFNADTTNPGLAHWYNLALNTATDEGISWLLLLDQDTAVTTPYLTEIVTEAKRRREQLEIVAVVPKLLQGGTVCSPLTPPTYRHPRPFDRNFTGIAASALHVFNSGSLLRVSAVNEIGGFPSEFPLDYLDHATFSALQSRGGRLFVLQSALEHELSSSNVRRTDAAAVDRHRRTLRAEREFYRRTGSVKDRIYRRIRLIRGALGVLIKHGAVAWSFRMIKAALSYSAADETGTSPATRPGSRA